MHAGLSHEKWIRSEHGMQPGWERVTNGFAHFIAEKKAMPSHACSCIQDYPIQDYSIYKCRYSAKHRYPSHDSVKFIDS